MTDTSGAPDLPNLELLGNATEYAALMNSLVQRSPLFENFNLAEIRLLTHFMQVYRAPAEEMVSREGDAGDFLMLVLEGLMPMLSPSRWRRARRSTTAPWRTPPGVMAASAATRRSSSAVPRSPMARTWSSASVTSSPRAMSRSKSARWVARSLTGETSAVPPRRGGAQGSRCGATRRAPARRPPAFPRAARRARGRAGPGGRAARPARLGGHARPFRHGP